MKKTDSKNIIDSQNFEIWDIIYTWWINSFKIKNIVWEYIYLEWDISSINVNDKIMIFKDDTNIIWNTKIWLWNKTSCTNYTNLKENSCPISDKIDFFIPYKIN